MIASDTTPQMAPPTAPAEMDEDKGTSLIDEPVLENMMKIRCPSRVRQRSKKENAGINETSPAIAQRDGNAIRSIRAVLDGVENMSCAE
jgi:hypothetical protein